MERHLTAALETARMIVDYVPDHVDGVPSRSRWTRACLELAGMDGRLVEHPRPDGRVRWFVTRLVRETFWDLAFLRPPSRVRRTLSASMSLTSRRLRDHGVADAE